MPKQTAISKVNEQYLKDRENGYTREYTNTENTARQMLEEYEQEQREEAERRQQRQYAQYQSQQNAELADWIRGMYPSALADDAQQRRLDAAQGVYTTDADTKHQGSGRSFGTQEVSAPASQKKRAENDTYRKYLAQYDGISNQTLFTNADYMQNSARAAQMDRDRMASDILANPSLIYSQNFTQGLSGATARADATAQAANRLTNEYNRVADMRRKLEESEQFDTLRQNADYTKYSQGNAETAARANNSLSPKMIRYYNIYNRAKIQAGATTGAPAEAYVNDDEAGRYFYIWEKQGADAADAYYNTYVKSRAQERRTNAERANVQALAASSPVMGAAMSAASVPLQATGIIGMIDLTVQNAERRFGINTDKPINYNTAWQAPSGQASAIRESVANKIQTDVTKNLIESGHSEQNANFWGSAASFLYQTGMSMADSGVQALLVRVGLPQEAMLTLMAGGAGMNAIREAKQRGASDGQALAYGYAAAFAEGIFEHVSLENLMNAKTPETIRQGIVEVLKQAFAEGSEEFSTTYANTLTDMLINGGQSEISQKVLGYMSDGLSNKEAYKAAAINWLKGAGMDFLGGALSGGAMGGMNVGVNLGMNVKENFQAGLVQEDLRNIGRAQQAELAARQAYQAAQERTTPPLPQQAAQEQQERVTTPPLPQSAQRAAETQQNNGLRIPTEDNARTGDVTGALRDVNPGIVEAMSEDTTIRDAVNAVNAEVQKGMISAEAGAEFLDMMWQAGSDNESRQGFLRSIYDTNTGELRPQALNAARRIDARTADQTLRLSDNAPAERQAPLTVGPANVNVNENRQEGNNGQKQTEAAAASEFRLRARENAAGREALDRGEWTAGVARLLEAARNTRTNRNLQQRADAAARLQDQAEARRLVRQSGQDLGIEDASDAKTVTILDNDMLGKEWEQMVSYYASKGVKLQAMIGQIETKDLRANGMPVTVRAWVSGDGKNIVVQADHPTISWQQLLAHEELHRRIKENSAFKKAAQDALLADKSLKPYLSQIIDRYTEAYRAVKPNITDDEVIEELLADYRAGFDMLDPLGTLAGVRKATKAASRDIRALERKGLAPTESIAEEQTRGNASIEIGKTAENGEKDEGSRNVSPVSEVVQKSTGKGKTSGKGNADRRRSGEPGTLGYGGAREYGGYEQSERAQIDKFINRLIEHSTQAAKEVSGRFRSELHESIYEMMQNEAGFIKNLVEENGENREIIAELEEYLERLGAGRTAEINDIRKSYTPEFVKKYTQLAENYFGTTEDFDKAGYIDTDGKLLDFNKGSRDAINHREVYKVLDFLHEVVGRNDGMIEFLNMGNIRITEEGLELSKKPNAQQRAAIRDFVEHYPGGFRVDITGEDGKNLENQYYSEPKASKILSDIDTYFRDGVYPKQSDVARFHSQYGNYSTEIPYNRTALLSEETVDRWLKDYAAKSSPKYAQAYVTRMSPDQFLKLTTSRTGRLTISSQTGPMDAEQLIKSTQEQPLQLIIRDGEVVGHEGRHRVTALSRANVQSIPVLVFDSSNKYSKTDVPEMVLQGQDFGSSRSYDRVTLENLTPLSYENRDKIVQEYGKQDAFERSAEKIGLRQTMKFSLNMPVEETADLIALHNLNAEKLEKALNLGGFPMPSIAVTKTTIPHTNFGDITLVMNKDTIDPQKNRKNTVYSADAWTPTFPGVEYEVDEKVASRLRSKYYELYRKYGNEATRPLYPWGNYAADELNRKGGLANVIKQAQDDVDLMKLYLIENGMDVPAAVTEESVSRLDDDTIALYDRLANAVGKEAFEELRPQNGESPIQTRRRWWEAHRDAFEQEYKKYILELGFTEEEANNVLENETTNSQTRKAIEIRNYLKNGPEKRTTSTNVSKTNDAIRAAVDQEKYAAWINDLFAGLEKGSGIYNGKDRYTPSGNERSFSATHYPVTLENIAKAMAAQNDGNTKNVSGFHGVKTLRAGMAKRFSSIQEMHEYEGRLKHLSQEEADSITEALADRLANVMQTIYDAKKHNKYDNSFIEMDTIGEILMEATDQKDITADSIRELFWKYRYNIDRQTAENVRELLFDVSEMPVNIFEAKPERAVRFNEVLAAVVPSGTSAELVNSLKKAGVERILEYQKDNDEDRLEKVNSIQEAKFSREIDAEYMAAAESGDTEKAQRMVDEAAKRAGYTIKAYHGTPNKFNVFLKSKIGSTTDYGWFGRGFYFTTKKDVADVYAGYLNDSNVIEAYLKVQNPFVFSDYPGGENMSAGEIMDAVLGKKYGTRGELTEEDKAQRSEDFTDWLRGNGYDAAEIWSQIMILDSEQAKRTDPVTYDNDGNIIPLSERFNSADMDIRYSVEIDPDVAAQFSMEGIEERQVQSLLRENEELKKKLKDAKAQIKTSDRTQPREEDVRRMAKDILKAYSSKAEGVNESLRELAHTIMSNDTRWTDVRDQAVRLAGKILENSSALVGEDAALNREIRNAIRKEKIAYTNNGNIADYGQWRKDNFGKLKIAKDGIPIEIRWDELQDTYGKGYFPDDIKNPADQIVYLSELFDRLQDVYENPYNQNMAEATEFLANDIIDRVISGEMRQAPTTYADRAETRLARETLRGELRVQKVKERLGAERERRQEKIAELKEHYKDKEAKGKENRKARDMRAKIINHAKQMTTELLKPTDKKHVPESLRQSVAAVLSAIDLGSGYDVTSGQDGKALRVGRGTEGAEQTKRTKAFMELRESLLKEADGLVLDPELLGTVEEPGSLTRLVTELADVPIANMNTEQLQVVYDALRGVEGAVKSANRMLSSARWAAVGEAADAIRSENISKQAPLQLAGAAGRAQDLTRLDMLTPEGYFHRLGKSGQAVFKMLRGAQDKFITNMTKATDDTQKIVGDTDVGALEKEKHTVTMGGEEVTMTTAQIMELYCLMQRDQGLQHITTGGIMIEPVRQGIKQTTQAEPLHPSMEELLDAVRLLTPEEIRLANAMQDYLSKDMAEMGNEATLAVYGYKKFGQESKYWKIRSNKNEIQQSIEKETQTTSVANRGFTKAVNPQANTSVKIGSIFDTYSQSVNDMATYAAWLAVGEDVNRIRNYVFRDSEGQRTGTVKGVLDRVIGSGGANYLQRLLADIANGAGMDDAGLTSGFVGAYKAAAIGANIRVIIQQPTAILRAAEMIDPKYLAEGLKNPMKAFERAKEYSPIAQWKDWGYFDINTGRKMKDVLFESSSKLEKVRQVSMAMAGKADSFAWGQLWGAVEAETKAKTDLKPGTRDFYEACAERFNDIIDHTQVVDGILQRSQIMRSKNAITRMAVSFMSEPTKQYNQFMSAVYDYRNSGDKKQAKQALARTTFSMLAAGVMNVLAQSIVDALRNDDREKKYWEKLLQSFLGYNPDDDTFGEKFKTFAFSNMGELINPATYLPYAKDIMSIIQGYSVDRMDMDGISDTITAITRLAKALNGEGKQTVGYTLGKAIEQGAKLLGLSAYNVDRDLMAMITTIANDADMPVLQYYLNRYRYRPGDNLSKELKGILWDARQKNDGSYDVIVEHLLKDGYTQEQIDTSMMNRLSDESGFTEARKAADAEGNNNGSYDLSETLEALENSTLSEEDRDVLLEAKLSDKQYGNYTTLLQYSDYDTWLSVMREMPANLSQAKIEAVLDKRDDLTTKQKAAYWQVLSGSKSTKNNPYSQEVGAEILNAKAENQPDKEPEKVAQMRATLSGLGLQDSKVDALAPVLGGDGSNTSKWRAVANQNLGKDQQDAVLKSIMTDSMYRNWTIATGENISLDSYVKGREAYVDLDNSGTDQNSEWTAALEKVSFDKDATRNNYIKGVLWQIYTGSTSTKNNPFDKSGGQKVLDAKGKGGGSGSGSYAPARIPTLRLPDIPRAEKPSSGLRIRAAAPAQAPRSGLRIRAK